MHARAELLDGRSDNLLAYVSEAMKILYRYKTTRTYDIIKKLAMPHEWSRIVELINMLAKEGRFYLMRYYSSQKVDSYLQRAGKKTGELQCSRLWKTFIS